MQTLRDLLRMARRELFVAMLRGAPTVKRRIIARAKDGHRPLALRWMP